MTQLIHRLIDRFRNMDSIPPLEFLEKEFRVRILRLIDNVFSLTVDRLICRLSDVWWMLFIPTHVISSIVVNIPMQRQV